MKKIVGVAVAAVLFEIFVSSAANACYCEANRIRRSRACCCRETCQTQCFTVMKTCQKTVYEEKECTFYKTVYEQVVDKKPVDTTKFVEGVAYKCAPYTGMVPKTPDACAPAKPPCAPAQCESAMTPVQCMIKVPYTTMNEVPAQKIEEVSRVVEKQVPYTVICCIPKTVCVEVPVTVCCPAPRCCKCAAQPSSCNCE
jgi:hypothetical protein